MPARVHATIGRAPDNDVVLDHPSVSNHHARLSWSGSSLLIEDLSSANGTFVDGRRIKALRTRPGVELLVGQVVVPWSHDGLRTLLKAGIGARTLVIPVAGATSTICGACGRVAELSKANAPKSVTCPGCGATLRTAMKAQGQGASSAASRLLTGALVLGSGALSYTIWLRAGLPMRVPTSVSEVQDTVDSLGTITRLGPGTAQKIAAALTPTDALTRDTAIKLAARAQGPYHIEQVAEIWNAVRSAWRYVNDPRGREYFATASETIQNGYVGDCDDFATTLASMVIAIGGEARVIVMDGPEGGHAYTEACVQSAPTKLATELNKYYRTRWKHYLGGRALPRSMAYRSTEHCPVWLNLDWNSIVPGGPYQAEHWAVAVYEDGHSEQVAVVAPSTTGSTRAGTAANASVPSP